MAAFNAFVKQQTNARYRRGLQWLVSLALCTVVIGHLDFEVFIQQWKKLEAVNLSLVLILLLMPLNWYLEACKWQQALSKYSTINREESMRSVLYGLAFHSVSPYMVGDFAGKYLPLRNQIPFKSFLRAMLQANGAQYMVTLGLGIVGLSGILFLGYTLPIYLPDAALGQMLAALLALVLVGAYAAWYFRNRLLSQIRALPRRLSPWLIQWAFVRYLVFATQFYLALQVFEVRGDGLTLLCGIALMFLVKSMLPALNVVANLGVRETAAALVFGSVLAEAEGAFSASLLIWCINLLLPAMGGTLLLLYDRSTKRSA